MLEVERMGTPPFPPVLRRMICEAAVLSWVLAAIYRLSSTAGIGWGWGWA